MPSDEVMGCADSRRAAAEKTRGHVTLVFVDIDGVLNIGISDPGYGGALSCNTENICRLNTIREGTRLRSTSWQRLLAVSTRNADDGNSTYGELCKGSPDAELSSIYVERLAALVSAAEMQGRVICVLSSTWRIKNLNGVRVLEEGVSKHMGKPFAFDAKTDAEETGTPSGRLENIGSYLTQWVKTSAKTFDSVRALVLEDFHITPLDGWPCQGMSMTSVQDVEAYLYKCLPPDIDAAVRFVHTFDQWTTNTGMDIRVGAGLTLTHFSTAKDFLNKSIEAFDVFVRPEKTAMACEDTDTGGSQEAFEDIDDSFLDDDSPFERGISCAAPQCPSSAQPMLLTTQG